MATVGGSNDPPVVGLNQFNRPGYIDQVAVKIIGRTQEDDRAGQSIQVEGIGKGLLVEIVICFIADPTTRRRCGLDAFVDSSGKCGDFATHGVPIDPESFSVDLRLLFQKGEGATCTQGPEKIAAISRRLYLVQRIGGSLDTHGTGPIPGRCMVAVQCGPVRGDLVVRMISGLLKKEGYPITVDFVVRCIYASGPGNRDRSVTPFGIG